MKLLLDIFSNYKRQRNAMVSAPRTSEHPNGDFIVNTHLAGKFYLRYVALMSIAASTGYTSQEMIDRIIKRGITNEFTMWRDATSSGRIPQVIGK